MAEKPGDITEFSLYSGRVRLTFKESSHRYSVTIDKGKKQKCPSVTTVTGLVDKSGAIQNWAIRQTLEACRGLIAPGVAYSVQELDNIFEIARKRSYVKKQEAADIGTWVHSWLEMFFHGENPEMPPPDSAEKSCVDAALAWVDKHKVKFIHNERPIYSLVYGVTGRMDGICLVDGKKSVIDFKTGNKIYVEAMMQVSAYQEFFEEETGEQIEQRVIVRLGKEDGRFSACILETGQERDFASFLGALTLYKGLKLMEKDLRKAVFSTNPEEKDFLAELEESLSIIPSPKGRGL